MSNIKNYFNIIILFLLISSQIKLEAQNVGTIRGHVTDINSGESLLYANVLIKELQLGASTNENGYFIFTSIPPNNNYTILASYVGYENKEIQFVVQANRVTKVDISLKPTSFELQTVEKVGQKKIETNATDVGLQVISMKELESLPQGVETDLFRSLQYVPGVKTTGDISSRYYVRGGSSDQNLVLLNGSPVYNPFHALGIFSIFDPEIVNSMELYKGGFPAEFGGKVSSVLNIITKDGNKNNFNANGSISLLTGKVLLEGPIPSGSYIISARKTYSNSIFKKFLNNQDVPLDFYDFSFKVNYSDQEISEGTKIILHGFSSQDKINRDSELSEDYLWKNNLFGIKWMQVANNSPVFWDMGITLSTYQGEIIPKLSNVKPQLNDVRDVSFKANFNYVFDSRDEAILGFDIKDIQTKLKLENSRGAVSDIISKGSQIAAYAKYKFLRFDNLGIDLGARLNIAQLSNNNGSTIDPRINITYSFIPQVSIKLAWGKYQQDLITLTKEDQILTLFEPWLITPDYLQPTSSTHYIGGITLRLIENLSFSLEGYYKLTENLPAVNENKIYDSDRDFIAGEGEAYGWETSIGYNDEVINITASYSNSWSYKTVDGWIYYPKYDIRHSLNTGFALNIGAGWLFSAMWIYNSGLPFTQLTGYYDKYYVNDIYFNEDYFDSTLPYTLLGDKNIARLPDYHRLDLTLSKKISISKLNMTFNFSVLNVYDRKNILYFNRETGERVNMLPFLPTATLKVEL
ncbi:MAG: TonB-dependent receptor [Ignavibacteriae bacterium]|nr:TonB-dependent receptor [Ignavibacteriota bacterium]